MVMDRYDDVKRKSATGIPTKSAFSVISSSFHSLLISNPLLAGPNILNGRTVRVEIVLISSAAPVESGNCGNAIFACWSACCERGEDEGIETSRFFSK